MEGGVSAGLLPHCRFGSHFKNQFSLEWIGKLNSFALISLGKLKVLWRDIFFQT